MRKIFALPPGADFPQQLVLGLRQRFADQPPEALGRVTLFLNSQRMRRRVSQLLTAEGAALLPRLRLVTDLSPEAARLGVPPSVPALRRRLELTQLIVSLLEATAGMIPEARWFSNLPRVGNIGSASVARSLGFRFEGALRLGAVAKDGSRVDEWVAGLLRTDDRTPVAWSVLAG